MCVANSRRSFRHFRRKSLMTLTPRQSPNGLPANLFEGSYFHVWAPSDGGFVMLALRMALFVPSALCSYISLRPSSLPSLLLQGNCGPIRMDGTWCRTPTGRGAPNEIISLLRPVLQKRRPDGLRRLVGLARLPTRFTDPRCDGLCLSSMRGVWPSTAYM